MYAALATKDIDDFDYREDEVKRDKLHALARSVYSDADDDYRYSDAITPLGHSVQDWELQSPFRHLHWMYLASRSAQILSRAATLPLGCY